MIWIIEDDKSSQFVFQESLRGISDLSFFERLETFLESIELSARSGVFPNLVIADLRLPGMSFLDFLISPEGQELAQRVPVFVVSSLDDLQTLRQCFHAGAVDYMIKPFRKSELIARVERILSEKAPARESITSDKLMLDPVSLRICLDGAKSEQLTSREFQLVSAILASPTGTLSRNELLDTVWKSVSVGSKTLDVHLFNLRKKLAPLGIEIRFSAPNLYSIGPTRSDG